MSAAPTDLPDLECPGCEDSENAPHALDCARLESEEDYWRACDAIWAANPHRFEGEL